MTGSSARNFGTRSIKEECLTKLILFGEHSLRRVVSNFLEHYHQERNHQGKDNQLLFPARRVKKLEQPVNQKPAMMDGSHERQSMGSPAGVCHGVGQSGTASAERVPRCGEPYSPRTPAGAAAPVGSGALHAG